jgi:hypothetical protein
VKTELANCMKTEMKSNVTTQMEAMSGIVLSNLKTCCQEILDWHNTGTLVIDGKVMEAASRLTDDVFSGHQLVHVENDVKLAAMEFVVESSVKICEEGSK